MSSTDTHTNTHKIFGPYMDTIRKVEEILRQGMDEEVARAIAPFIVIAHNFGRGDAWAGLILLNMVRVYPDIIDKLHEALKRNGIEVMKPRLRTHFMLFVMIRDAIERLKEKHPELGQILR